MQLNSFDKKEKTKNNKTTILVVVAFLFVVAIVLGRSFALYKKEEEKRVSNGQVGIFCSIGETWDFDYVKDAAGNGYEQDFVIPCDGSYKIEVWGAQGGTYLQVENSGLGGYATGTINTTKDNTLYINVGGQGAAAKDSEYGFGKEVSGGYNGGGNGRSWVDNKMTGSGGGATHIATKSGLLRSFSKNDSNLLIVAGGGGGAGGATLDGTYLGGSGGGYKGTNGYANGYNYIGTGGTQDAGGASVMSTNIIENSGIGKGEYSYEQSRTDASLKGNSSGGGGGYYGGGSGIGAGGYAGGGSGYIGNTNLKDKVMYCYNCAESEEENTRTISTTNMSETAISKYAKRGNGYARITYLGYSESELNGADPVLKDNLIPVTIENDGTVRKADISKEWYNYENKQWANAVILVDKTKSYSIKDIIPESNIESYFVWIPKYSYQLWDLGNYNGLINSKPTIISREIKIRFGLSNTNDANTNECTTPMTSGASGNCTVGDFMTHPAFISMNTNGLWVGKFETGYKGATTTTEAEITSTDTSKIIIKPNVYSWRYNPAYNIFVSSYNYQRTLDSHMIKNTEWGAISYLAHSKYGINSDVRVNNNANLLTGYSANFVPTCYSSNMLDCNKYGTTLDITQPYNTEAGYKSSTTGNITGIYDLSGNAFEHVASYVNGNYVNSGFNATTIAEYNSKYFDVYNGSSTGTTYLYRILGDATGETGPFYNYADADNVNRNHNVYDKYSTFVAGWGRRGGAYIHGNTAGLFFSDASPGNAQTNTGSRIVLAP